MYGYEYTNHLILNEQMVNLWQEEDGKKVAEVWVLPGYGANLCRFKVDNIDYLYPAPQKLVDIRHYGTPVLYPTPGIVRGEKFTFDGSLYRFPANRGSIFRHGFAMGQKFLFSEPIVSEDGVTLKTSLGIFRDHPLYYLFPIANRLDIDFTLKNRSVRIDITVTDLDTQKRFPFGFGLHPYFNLIGPREENLIQVPVKKWLDQAENQLIDPNDSPIDFRSPTTVPETAIDEVWTGLTSEASPSIIYQSVGKRLVLHATDDFTHFVTYEPENAPYVCLENWTCSPDAHNLYAGEKNDVAHLLILNPGEVFTGSVQFSIEPLNN